MNDVINRFLKFNYYRNRITATLGLMVSLFFPAFGALLTGTALYRAIKSKDNPTLNHDKHDFLFCLVSLILVGMMNLFYLIAILQNADEIVNQVSQVIKLII